MGPRWSSALLEMQVGCYGTTEQLSFDTKTASRRRRTRWRKEEEGEAGEGRGEGSREGEGPLTYGLWPKEEGEL